MSASFLKNLKKAPSVKKLLHQKLCTVQPGRSFKTAHASDLTKPDYCPRRVALYLLAKMKPPPERLGTSLASTFAMGRMVEGLIRNEWLVDHVVGWWECVVCRNPSRFGKKPKGVVGGCESGCRWEYVEPRFKDPTTGISCGVDFLIQQDTGKHLPVECKIMDKDMFRDLMMPMAEHKLRTQLYLYLIANSDNPVKDRIDTSQALVLYVSRSYGFKDEEVYGYGVKDDPFSPFKEFVVKRNDEALQKMLEKGAQLETFKQKGIMPPGICNTPMEPVAKKCKVCKTCFSGKYPAGEVVPEFEDD